MKWKW